MLSLLIFRIFKTQYKKNIKTQIQHKNPIFKIIYED